MSGNESNGNGKKTNKPTEIKFREITDIDDGVNWNKVS